MEQERLKKLYEDINSCSKCHFNYCPTGGDDKKVLRRFDAVDADSSVVVISEALAEKGLRVSGVSFFGEDGSFVDSGKRLESFLNTFNYTLRPPHDVQLQEGIVDGTTSAGQESVYCTEIVQCFPGKSPTNKTRNIDPTSGIVMNCSEFVIRELACSRPRVVILHGNVAWESFFRIFLKEEWNALENAYRLSNKKGGLFSSYMETFLQDCSIPLRVLNHFDGITDVHILTIYHSSRRSGDKGKFDRMTANERLVATIRSILS